MTSAIRNIIVFVKNAGRYLRQSRHLDTHDSIALRMRLARDTLDSFGIHYTLPDEAQIQAQPQCIYVANHASLLDALLIVATFGENLRILAKDSLFHLPWLGAILKKEKHIMVKRSSKSAGRGEAVREAIRNAIADGGSVLVFPEGTRTRDGNLGTFKHGAFYNAIQNQVPIVPIVVRGTFEAMPKTTLKIKSGDCSLEILPPIPLPDASMGDEKTRATYLCEQARNAILERLGH